MASKQNRLQADAKSAARLSSPQAWCGLLNLGQRLAQGPTDHTDVQGYAKWMNEMLFCDPVLPGMIAKLTSALSGQGWKIVGGSTTARLTSHVLENADGGRGWFHFSEAIAKSYLCRDMGAMVELARLYPPQVDATKEMPPNAWL